MVRLKNYEWSDVRLQIIRLHNLTYFLIILNNYVLIVFSVVQQTEASAVETSSVQAASLSDVNLVNPKIDKIANDITALNLIEVAELSDLLKKRLNLPDAPIMPMGGFAAMPAEVTVAIRKICFCF